MNPYRAFFYCVTTMNSTDEQMQLAFLMKEALLTAYDPEAIILFGSLGRGDGDEFSDVDLFVVIETDRNVEELEKEMAEYLNYISKDKHIIVRTPKDFCRQEDIPGTLVYSAVREGKILFDNKTWRKSNRPRDSYEIRKKEIINDDYIQSAREFLDQAETWLKKGNLFRFRDSIRFALARAIKAIFAKNDLQPPRELNPVILLSEAKKLEPDLARHTGLIDDLESYVPGYTDSLELEKGAEILKKVISLVSNIVQLSRSCFPNDMQP